MKIAIVDRGNRIHVSIDDIFIRLYDRSIYIHTLAEEREKHHQPSIVSVFYSPWVIAGGTGVPVLPWI